MNGFGSPKSNEQSGVWDVRGLSRELQSVWDAVSDSGVQTVADREGRRQGSGSSESRILPAQPFCGARAGRSVGTVAVGENAPFGTRVAKAG